MPPLLDPVRGVSEHPRRAGEMALALQEYRDALRYASRYGTGVALRDALEMRRLVAGGGAMRFVLDTCEKHGWRCPFFVPARNLRRHQWLDEALTAGHEIGSHSFSHQIGRAHV